MRPRGWGAREFPPEVASPRLAVPSLLPLGARDEEVEDGEGPTGLPSARRPLPATLPRRCGDSCERRWSAGKDASGAPRAEQEAADPGPAALGPAPACARRRRRSPPAPSREVGRNFSPPPARLARRACVLPGATCLPSASVSAQSIPSRSRPSPTQGPGSAGTPARASLRRRGAGEVSFGRSKGREQRPLPVPGVGGLPVGGHGMATVPGERAGEGGASGLASRCARFD